MFLLFLSEKGNKKSFFFLRKNTDESKIRCGTFLVYFLGKEIAYCILILSYLAACLEFYEGTSYHRKECSTFFHFSDSEKERRKVANG